MANIIQDKRELVKLSTAIKEYCGINVQSTLTIQQMKEALKQQTVSSSNGNSTVNNINTITTITNNDYACLENPDDLVALASVIRSKAGISQKLAVPQMAYLVKNFKKRADVSFNTFVEVTYFDDNNIYNQSDYYFKFWNGENLQVSWFCGYSTTIDNVDIQIEYMGPGSSGRVQFYFNSRYTYPTTLTVELYRLKTCINTITLTIDNDNSTVVATTNPNNPDQGGSGDCGDCGGSGGSFDYNGWYAYKKNFGTIQGAQEVSGDSSVTVEMWGQSFTLSAFNNFCTPYYAETHASYGTCQQATIIARFTEPSTPEGNWIIEVEIQAWGPFNASTPVTITTNSASRTENFVCDCSTIY